MLFNSYPFIFVFLPATLPGCVLLRRFSRPAALACVSLASTVGATPPDFLRGIVLPLGISFITFQKIAYLVDVWRGHHDADKFDRFAFFVLFFPQLIAGPIVLYRYIEPQILRWPASSRYL